MKLQYKKLFSLSIGSVFLIIQPVNKLFANPVEVTVSGFTYSVTWEKINYTDNISDFNTTKMPWWGDENLAGKVADKVGDSFGLLVGDPLIFGPLFAYEESSNESSIISVWFYDPQGFFTTGGEFADTISPYSDTANCKDNCPNKNTYFAYAIVTSISNALENWLQPYAAMQNVGLKSIHNNRDLVLAKAGECNQYGWVIGDSDYCVHTNAKNKVSYVNGDTTKGSYGSAVFNSSLNVEKTINERWKAGIAYGVGSSNLYDFDFSSTTANLNSTNTHYSIYGVKKVNDKFTLKGIIGGSDFDYKGERNYLTTSATSSYDSDGYTAEINGSWDIKKTIKNTKNPIRLQPSFGVAYAAHTQDGFSESGSGDLITIDPNQAESLLFKTGIAIDKQILMEGGKWLLVPSIALNYEVDAYAYSDHRGLKGSLTESSTASTRVSAKNMGEQTGSVKVGADFVLTKDLMFNLNAKYGLADGGDEQSYGGGFRLAF